jgi:hypothetical protein
LNIGTKTKDEIIQTLNSLATDYLKEIDEAYSVSPGALDITFKVRLSPSQSGGTLIDSDIAFVKGVKIKDRASRECDEKQGELFGGE